MPAGAAKAKAPETHQHERERISDPPRPALIAALWRSHLCRCFVHQFSVMATRAPPETPRTRRRGGKKGEGGRWRPFRVAPKRAPGLAAAKQGRGAGLHAPASHAVDSGWPEDMQRELRACRTLEAHRAWSEKWADRLNGRVAREQTARPQPLRPTFVTETVARRPRRLAV
jgi:hypothetical protein